MTETRRPRDSLSPETTSLSLPRDSCSPDNDPHSLDALIRNLRAYLGHSSGISSYEVQVEHLKSLLATYRCKEEDWRKFGPVDPSKAYVRLLVDGISERSNLVNDVAPYPMYTALTVSVVVVPCVESSQILSGPRSRRFTLRHEGGPRCTSGDSVSHPRLGCRLCTRTHENQEEDGVHQERSILHLRRHWSARSPE